MTIAAFDPELSAAMVAERRRQEQHLELIASENYASPRVLEAQGSVLTNKYAEGYPGKRYYGGCEYVDVAEQLAIDRAKQLFGAAYANVQPHSGSQANAAVYLALLKPGETLLGMSLDHGDHLTHGAKVNFSGRVFNAVQYGLDPATGEIDYAQAERRHPDRPARPGAFLFTGFSARVRDLARRVGRKWLFVVVVYFVLYSLVSFVLTLPWSYYTEFVRQHAYGLSNQALGKWASDTVRGLLVGLEAGSLFIWVPFLLLKKSPRRWWLYTSLAAVPFIVLLLLVTPVWIEPLFNEFGPMKDKALEADILSLAGRAGIEGGRVFEVNKSVDTKAVNAFVTGIGETKRIVLWDTILAKLERREVLFVMGHEMGHYVLGHVPKTIAVVSLLILVTLYVAHRTASWFIARFRDRFGFDSLADVAALPLLLLLSSAFSLVVTPALQAYSRHQEHESDRFALEITRDNRAGATAFVKLQAENLGIPRPGLLYKLWRSSHPPLGERIDFCNDYRPWETGAPLEYERLHGHGALRTGPFEKRPGGRGGPRLRQQRSAPPFYRTDSLPSGIWRPLLAEGTKIMGERLNAGYYAIHVKGLEVDATDPRAHVTRALTYSVATRGSCHLRGFPYIDEFIKPEEAEAFFGTPAVSRLEALEGKGKMVAWSEDWVTLADLAGVCKFAWYQSRNFPMLIKRGLELMNEILVAVTGLPLTPEVLLRCGERVYNACIVTFQQVENDERKKNTETGNSHPAQDVGDLRLTPFRVSPQNGGKWFLVYGFVFHAFGPASWRSATVK